MNQIIINNKHLTTIARALGEEFNKIEFLNWYHSINPSFKIDLGGVKRSTMDKYFDGSKERLKVFSLPELEINNEDQLKKLISIPHGSYREPLIKLLKEEFEIDFWAETLRLCLIPNNKFNYMTYYSLLSHSMNDADFTINNLDKMKELVELLIDNVSRSQSKYYAEILQYISFGISNKDGFENDWLVKQINEVFKIPNDGSSKQFNFYVDKLTNQFIDLDFSKFNLCPALKKIMKGKLPLTTANSSNKNCFPFFWEVDMPRFCISEKVVQQLLQSNCITGLDIIDRFLKNEPGVISHFIKREKNKISLTVIHEDVKLEEKLNSLLHSILNTTRLNSVINESEFEKSLLFIALGDSLTQNDSGKKRTKI